MKLDDLRRKFKEIPGKKFACSCGHVDYRKFTIDREDSTGKTFVNATCRSCGKSSRLEMFK